MEAKDLMIGDWVLHEGEPYQIRQLGIYGVDRDGEDYPAVCVGKPKGIGLIVDRNEIEPIPLTQEILEKNGFVNVENTLTSTIIYSFRDSLFRIDVYDFDHIEIYSYYTDSSCDTFISSVHELQHALKLCGIEKEITP